MDKNKDLAAELDRDSLSDGELLDGMDQHVLYYDEELSYRPRARSRTHSLHGDHGVRG